MPDLTALSGQMSTLRAPTSPMAVNLLDAKSLLSSFGAVGIFLVLFAETGLLIGFFLPGDSLLFTAGLLATTNGSATLHLSLGPVLLAGLPGLSAVRRPVICSGGSAVTRCCRAAAFHGFVPGPSMPNES